MNSQWEKNWHWQLSLFFFVHTANANVLMCSFPISELFLIRIHPSFAFFGFCNAISAAFVVVEAALSIGSAILSRASTSVLTIIIIIIDLSEAVLQTAAVLLVVVQWFSAPEKLLKFSKAWTNNWSSESKGTRTQRKTILQLLVQRRAPMHRSPLWISRIINASWHGELSELRAVGTACWAVIINARTDPFRWGQLDRHREEQRVPTDF